MPIANKIHIIKYIGKDGWQTFTYHRTKAKAEKWFKEHMDKEYKPRIVGDFVTSYEEVEFET